MLTVYAIPVSLYCAKLRIVLRHKELDWQELPPPGGYGSDEFAGIVPSGNLPALIDGDVSLADSEAITEYLNEAYPLPAMLPEQIPERAKVRERSRFHDTRLEPALRVLFPHIAKNNRDLHKARTQSRQISILLNTFATFFLQDKKAFGMQLTLGDCGFPITLLWIELLTPVLGLEIEWPEEVSAYRQHVQGFTAVENELTDYRSKLVDWLQSDDV